jgi:energy-converting hydrogenase Eha subunit A/multisubunit Na+/H+ antiporter MnhF subunit
VQDATRANLVIYAVVVLLILFRASRPQRTSVTRMWIFAGLLMLIGVFAIYESVRIFGSPPWEIAVAVVLGLLAGIPLGLLRGHHTQVTATDRHGVMQLGPSWATALIYIGAFAARAVIRLVVPPTNALGMVVSDGLIVFAIGIVGATYYAVYRKYEALDHAQTIGR